MFGMSGWSGVFVLLMWATPYLLGVAALALAWRFVRVRETQAAEGQSARQLEQRVQFLEESLARMSSQLDRLSASQEFTAQLLEARADAPRSATSQAS